MGRSFTIHRAVSNQCLLCNDQKGTVRHRRLSLRPKSIPRTKRLPSPCQKPPNPSTTWENLVADSEVRQCHNDHTHARQAHYKGRPARSQCAHARWGRPNSSLSHSHSLTHSVLCRPPPSLPKRRSSPYLLAQCAPRTAANTPAQQKALNDGTGPLIASLSRCGPAPQK